MAPGTVKHFSDIIDSRNVRNMINTASNMGYPDTLGKTEAYDNDGFFKIREPVSQRRENVNIWNSKPVPEGEEYVRMRSKF
jgi:hypothetical protein